jgi:hypothetical protein
MPEVALVSLMHDPEGRLYRTMGSVIPRLLSLFAAHYVVVSASTQPAVAEELTRLGIVWRREEGPGVGAARRQAVALARGAGHDATLYCDLDRALHWAQRYPAEFAATRDLVGTVDFLVIGRTPRAFATHPRVMTETEALANRTFALAHHRPWDLCAAACGLSAPAADVTVQESRVLGFGTEAEWPALALRSGLTADYVAVEGLEYETPDRYPEEVALAGGLAAWTEAQSLSAANWVQRLGLATDIARACLPQPDDRHP